MIPTEKLLEIQELAKKVKDCDSDEEFLKMYFNFITEISPAFFIELSNELISGREVIGFYADNKSWCKDRPSSVRYDIIYPHDVDKLYSAPRIFGGIRAREHQRKFSV